MATSVANLAKAMAPVAPGCLHNPVDYAVLGQLRVGHPGGDLTPPGQRARDLLAVLLTRRGRCTDQEQRSAEEDGPAEPGQTVTQGAVICELKD